jgi:hypothetical protein
MTMGGFMLYDSDGKRPLYPLDLKKIEELVQKGAVDIPDIPEREIQDKSKGDVVSKGLAVIQTGWFILQCIARRAEHMVITELEIMTVAFAFLNFVTYLFWWSKPLKVTFPIRIVLKEGHPVPEPTLNSRGDLANPFLRIVTLLFPNRDVEVDLFGEKRVPAFYAGGMIDGDVGSFYALYFAEGIIAMIFGGIHCTAWSFSFPTHVEQTLWRVSSIAITAIPISCLMTTVLISLISRLHVHRGNAIKIAFVLVMMLLVSIYPFFRSLLLILSFTTLRSLPPSALYTIRWITLIPHV